ncbi:hypothetical protein [Nitrincola sp. A-D6]|uniref:hypothetical protein n=1 Tax=Nitrincola sp. A-D6 TaxID=1545442 RepID=UPI0013639F08|nr:hypothetical protein [Nitrincola sp. A-D6]
MKALFVSIWLLFVGLIGYGWVTNIIKLVGADAITGLEVARIAGILITLWA